MQSNLMCKPALDVADLQYARQEFAQFHRPTTHRGCTVIVVVAQMFIVIADHRNATARRSDDVVVSVKHVDEFCGERPGLFHVATVCHGLSTASLFCREHNLNAEMFQHRHSCHPDVWIELIDVARYEQGDFHEFTTWRAMAAGFRTRTT